MGPIQRGIEAEQPDDTAEAIERADNRASVTFASSLRDAPLPEKTIAFGEVGFIYLIFSLTIIVLGLLRVGASPSYPALDCYACAKRAPRGRTRWSAQPRATITSRIGDVLEVDHAAALADDVQQVAMFTGRGVG